MDQNIFKKNLLKINFFFRYFFYVEILRVSVIFGIYTKGQIKSFTKHVKNISMKISKKIFHFFVILP